MHENQRKPAKGNINKKIYKEIMIIGQEITNKIMNYKRCK